MSEDRAPARPVATRTTLVLSGCGEVDEGEKVGSLVRHLTDSLLCVSLEQLASRPGRPWLRVVPRRSARLRQSSLKMVVAD